MSRMTSLTVNIVRLNVKGTRPIAAWQCLMASSSIVKSSPLAFSTKSVWPTLMNLWSACWHSKFILIAVNIVVVKATRSGSERPDAKSTVCACACGDLERIFGMCKTRASDVLTGWSMETAGNFRHNMINTARKLNSSYRCRTCDNGTRFVRMRRDDQENIYITSCVNSSSICCRMYASIAAVDTFILSKRNFEM